MRRQQIQLNRSYTDGKGNVRLVIGVGEQYKLYPHQQNCDNLRYRVVKKWRGPRMVGDECNSTRISFAKWAQSEV
jgi:hypothetical protein